MSESGFCHTGALFIRRGVLDVGHVLNANSRDGVEDAVLLALFAEFQNLLSEDSYRPTEDREVLDALDRIGKTARWALEQGDISQQSYGQRIQHVYARGRAAAIMDALAKAWCFESPEGAILNLWEDIYLPTVTHVIRAFQAYLKKSRKDSGYVVPKKLFDRHIASVAGRWGSDQGGVRSPTAVRDGNIHLLPKSVLGDAILKESGAIQIGKISSHGVVTMIVTTRFLILDETPAMSTLWDNGLRDCDLLYFLNLQSIRAADTPVPTSKRRLSGTAEGT